MISQEHTQPPLIALLYRQSFAVLFANAIIPFPVAYMFWGVIDHPLLVSWCCAMFVVTLARIVLARWYFKLDASAWGDWRAWAWRFTVLSWATGALWGALGWFGYVQGEPHLLAFACIVLTGLTCGSVPSLSAFPPAYAGSMVAMLLPFAIRCMLGGTSNDTVYLIFVICLAAANLYYCRVTYRTLLETVRLRFENLQLIDQLGEERDRAQAANQSKTRFLAATSHDLRQPIHALSLFVSALATLARRGDVEVGQARHISGRMQAVVENLGQLLTGLLDVSKLDAGVMAVQRKAVPLGELLDDVQNEFAGLAAERGLAWRVVPSSAWVDTDPALLRRVLENLVSNAFRYTRDGGILLGCRRQAGGVQIWVIDTGIGIASDKLDQIFEEFVQLNDRARDGQMGTGLGLAIVRRIASLLDHPVAVRSRVGRGSIFAITVPTARPEAVVPTRPGLSSKASTIMVIDDDADVLDGISLLLTSWGHRVLAATDLAGLRQLHAESGAVHVDMIIADYRLAGSLRGTTAIAGLETYLGYRVAALIVTGDTSPERLHELQASGHAVLHKPLAADTLRDAIQRVLAGAAPTELAGAIA